MPTLKDMALRASHATTRSARYALGPGADLPIARIVAMLLILLPVAAVWIAINAARAAPSPAAEEVASFNPTSLFADNTPHFLPTPVAAVPADTNAAPSAPAANAQSAVAKDASEHVKIANTGGAGAILRSSPPRGQQVASLRDGTALTVIERQTLPDGSEWLHVKTDQGVEGWVFSKLVASVDQ